MVFIQRGKIFSCPFIVSTGQLSGDCNAASSAYLITYRVFTNEGAKLFAYISG
jgi:hypothetical protein